MEILQLRYFYESARNESFAKTAQKYMVPTTSVSASIKRLETELDCKLFDRFANKIILNENGKKLQQSLSLVFNELDQIASVLTVSKEDTREIKLLVRAMRGKITDYIIEYKTMHPYLSFKTVFDFSETDYEKYDIVIDDQPDIYTDYESFELCSVPIKLKAASSNPLCKKKLTLESLSKEPFLSMGEQSCLHRILMKFCKNAGFTPNIVVSTNDVLCYKKCLLSGVGIGIGRVDGIEQSGVSFLNVTDFNVRQTVYAFYKKQAEYGNLEHFIKFLKTKID